MFEERDNKKQRTSSMSTSEAFNTEMRVELLVGMGMGNPLCLGKSLMAGTLLSQWKSNSHGQSAHKHIIGDFTRTTNLTLG